MKLEHRLATCGECKLSTLAICPVCGRHVCEHRRGQCHDHADAVADGRVVVTYTRGARYSTRAESTRGHYSTQSSPGYYQRKDAAEWETALKRAGLTGKVIRVANYHRGTDWYGRSYGQDLSYYEVWIETTEEDERTDRQLLRDTRREVQVEILAAAYREDRESYNRKETIARYTGML